MAEREDLTATAPAERETEAVPTTREEGRYLTPPVDIFEDEEGGLTVLVDLPGVEQGGVNVNVENNILTIQGRVSRSEMPTQSHREFDLADYFRQFHLHEQVDQEKISAELRNGVLQLHLPKQAALKPRQIDVAVK